MTPAFVNCTQVTRINPGDKFRVTIEQTDVQRLVWGDEILSVYQKLDTLPWGFPISEPPLDNAPLMVVDIQIARSTVGSAPPGSVTEFYNSMADLLLFSSARYEVTRVEMLSTTAPIENRGKALDVAKQEQAASGLSGAFDGLKALGSNVKTVVIALAVLAGAVAVIYVAREARALRAA
jgi:hypothetical protein